VVLSNAAESLGVHIREMVLSNIHAVIGCEVVVAHGLAVVLRHAPALVTAPRVVVAGLGVALVGCELEIASGFAEVLRHALALRVAMRDAELHSSEALVC